MCEAMQGTSKEDRSALDAASLMSAVHESRPLRRRLLALTVKFIFTLLALKGLLRLRLKGTPSPSLVTILAAQRLVSLTEPVPV